MPDGRRTEVDALLARVRAWAAAREDVRAVALVGSWARGTATAGSDVDLVVLVDDPDRYLDDEEGGWVVGMVGEPSPIVRRQAWGPWMTERRVRLPSTGLEVEVGFTSLPWVAVDPVDPGTAEVIRDGGCTVVHDPERLLERLLRATG